MDLTLNDHQVQLVDTFTRLYQRWSGPDLVRKAEPLGHSADLWAALLDVGVVQMAIDDADSGWTAPLLDLALVAEQHGRFAAPAPVIEAQVAARLLARLESAPSRDALAMALAGHRMITLAVRPASTTAGLLPAGAVADDAVVRVGNRLLLVPLPPAGRRAVPNLGALPLADAQISQDARELADSDGAGQLHDRAVAEWMTLTASTLVGIAAAALDRTADYVSQRTAFGQPIGAFQGVAHPLADHATNIDGARLLACKAAWAADEDPHRFAELAAMALGFAMETARAATGDCLQFHGGNGFTLEYDIQLYFRRAFSWGAALGGPGLMYRRAAAARQPERGC